jgi:hypothetical protein
MPYLWKKGGVFIGGEPGLPRLGDWAGLFLAILGRCAIYPFSCC